MQAQVAVDLQALQPGSGASGAEAGVAAGWAGALARSGRLVGALLAPELPPPPAGAVPDAVAPALVDWDSAATARRLIRDHPSLVRAVPAPWLHTGAPDLPDMVPGSHWRRSGVPHAVAVTGPPPPGSAPERLERRQQWLASAAMVVDLSSEGGGPLPDLAGAEPPFSEQEWDDLVLRLAPSLDRLTRVPRGPVRAALFGPTPPAGGGIGVFNARFLDASARAGVLMDTVSSAGQRVPGHSDLDPASLGTDVRMAGYDALLYTVGNGAGHLPTVEAALRHPGWVWLHEGRLPAVFSSALDGLAPGEYTAAMSRLLELAYPGRAPLGSLRRAGRDHIALTEGGVGLTSLLVRRARGIIVNSQIARRVVLSDLPPRAWVPPVVVMPLPCPPLRPAETREGGRVVVSFGVVAPGKRPELLVDAAAEGGFDLAFVGPCPPIMQEFITDRAHSRGIADRVRVFGEVGPQEWWEWLANADVAVQLRDSTTGESSAAVTDALSAGLPVVTNLPSAAEYPEGTLQWVPSSSAAVVSAAVAGLLAAPERRRRMSEKAHSYAAAHQFEDLVGAFWSQILDDGQ